MQSTDPFPPSKALEIQPQIKAEVLTPAFPIQTKTQTQVLTSTPTQPPAPAFPVQTQTQPQIHQAAPPAFPVHAQTPVPMQTEVPTQTQTPQVTVQTQPQLQPTAQPKPAHSAQYGPPPTVMGNVFTFYVFMFSPHCMRARTLFCTTDLGHVINTQHKNTHAHTQRHTHTHTHAHTHRNIHNAHNTRNTITHTRARAFDYFPF